MRIQELTVMMALLAAGCGKGEECVDCVESDTDTDTDTDSDTDSDTDTDTEASNDTIDQAEPIELGTWDEPAVEDGIESAGDRDFYAIELTEGDYVWAYARGGGDEPPPDCVLRVYDPDKTQIGECDDLPYRMYGTDAGFFFRATTTGTYYVEVLEWSDWLDDEYPAEGGSGYDYELYLASLVYDELNENLNADNDTIAQEVENAANENYPYYMDPWSSWESAGDDYEYLWVAGAITDAEDVDHFAMTWSDDSVGAVEFSFWPGLPTELDPVFDLYNSAGDLVASTDDADVHPAYMGLSWDTGIRFYVDTADTYVLEVRDRDGGYGIDHYYGIFANGIGWNTDVVTVKDWSLEGAEADPLAQYTSAIMTESTTTADYFYGYGVGRFEQGDTWDSYRIDDGIEGGKILDIDVATMGVGSLLDAKVTVYDDSGAVVAAATDRPDYPDDPAVAITLPSGTTAPLYVVVEAENDARGMGAYYELSVAAYYE